MIKDIFGHSPNAINMEEYKNSMIISPEEEYHQENTWIFSF